MAEIRLADIPAKYSGRPCSEWTQEVLSKLARVRYGEAVSVTMPTVRMAQAKSSLPAQACRAGRARSVWLGIRAAVRGSTVYYWRED
jgi:hypothetical protein